MQHAVRKYLKALEAGDADKAGALFVSQGWVQSPFLGRIPVRDYVAKVAEASGRSELDGARRAGERGRPHARGRLLPL